VGVLVGVGVGVGVLVGVKLYNPADLARDVKFYVPSDSAAGGKDYFVKQTAMVFLNCGCTTDPANLARSDFGLGDATGEPVLPDWNRRTVRTALAAG
jgi:hypothetical protein